MSCAKGAEQGPRLQPTESQNGVGVEGAEEDEAFSLLVSFFASLFPGRFYFLIIIILLFLCFWVSSNFLLQLSVSGLVGAF